MTEHDWLTSADPAAMLGVATARAGVSGHPQRYEFVKAISDRKLRLFACACCRQVWDGAPCPTCKGTTWIRSTYPDGTYDDDPCSCGTGRVGGLTDPRSRRAVEVAERYADGDEHLSHTGLLTARRQAEAEDGWVWCATCPDIAVGLRQTMYGNNHPNSGFGPAVPPSVQAALLRDIFGNPWRPEEKGISSDVLEWNDGTVPRIAKAIYERAECVNMPILHDALLDAGCEDEDVLAHCRNAGPHVRGCWTLDLILGKSERRKSPVGCGLDPRGGT